MLRDWLRRIMASGQAPGQATRSAARPEDAVDRLIAEGNHAENEGRVREACELYRRAVSAAPGDARAHLNLGIGLEAIGDIEGAFSSYESALACDPADAYVNYNLAKLLYARGELARAERLLESALARKPEFPEARVVLSNVYDSQGKPAAAAGALEVALRQRPDMAGAWHNYAVVLRKLNRPADSITAYQEALVLAPDYVDAHVGLAKAFEAQGKHDDAIACYRKAASLAPGVSEIQAGLGDALKSLGRLDEAIACYQEALRLRPDFLDVHYNLGIAYHNLARHNEAIACFERVIGLKPDLAEAHYCLGQVFDDEDRHDESLACFQKAVSINPELPLARWAFAMSQLPTVYADEAEQERARAAFSKELEKLDRWFDATRPPQAFDVVGAHQPFGLAYQEANNRELLQRYGGLCARLMSDWIDRQNFPARAHARSTGAIRVGVVSQHIRNHSVWNAIVKGWFQQLDRARFSLHVFYLGAEQDPETRFAKSRASCFVDGRKGLRQWVDAIRSEQPDVLIYPEIGMDPMAARLASLRLAPVQAAAWGHPETTGLPTMDYYLSAEDFEPANARENYSEQLVALPHLGCFYQPSPVPVAGADLGGLGIAADSPLLICPGMPFKYAPRYDSVITEIARRLGRCRFIFFRSPLNSTWDKLRRRLGAAFARSGLRFEDFAIFIPWLDRPRFHSLLRRSDVYLDTIGFSGFNTAMQAVECGLPIVTREGRFMRGRLASGILRRMGLPELIAASEDEYVARAVKVVQDREYRKQIRDRVEASRPVLVADLAPIRAMEDFLVNAVNQKSALP